MRLLGITKQRGGWTLSAISDRFGGPVQPGTVTTEGIATTNRAEARPFVSEKVIGYLKRSDPS